MRSLFAFLAASAALTLVFNGESLLERLRRLLRRGRSVVGEVLAIDRVCYSRDRYYGVRLLMRTREGELAVHLGPSWFVNSQRLKLHPHDRIEVIGAPTTYDGRPTLIATAIRKGKERLRLRAADGRPLWHGS